MGHSSPTKIIDRECSVFNRNCAIEVQIQGLQINLWGTAQWCMGFTIELPGQVGDGANGITQKSRRSHVDVDWTPFNDWASAFYKLMAGGNWGWNRSIFYWTLDDEVEERVPIEVLGDEAK